MTKISIIGTVGIPANYGGFETLVEQLVLHKPDEDTQIQVVCSKKNYRFINWVFKGARLRYINLKANGFQSIVYDIISLVKVSRESDVILILGTSGCIFLPLYRLFNKNKKLIINIDGLEHRRDKWNKYVRIFLKFSEKLALRYGNFIISDNKGIYDYVLNEYGVPSVVIAYGGDHAIRETIPLENQFEILKKFNVEQKDYSLAICRIEPENNVHKILESFSQNPQKKILFIGNWNNSSYGRDLKEQFSIYPNIIIHDAVYDLSELNVIRGNCKYYIHGHSAGGTNPSLVEAMFFKIPIIAFDVNYNRFTLNNHARFFKSAEDLTSILNSIDNQAEMDAIKAFEYARQEYTWKNIAQKYFNLLG